MSLHPLEGDALPINKFHRLFRCGLSQAGAGHYGRALECLGLALECKPGEPRVLLQFGLALSEDGRYEKAVEALEKAAASRPAEAVYPLFLGMVHLEKGALEPARTALDRALELDRENALAKNYAALVEWEAGDRRKAVEALLAIDFIQSSRFEARLLVRVEEGLLASGHHESPVWSFGEGEGDGGERFILNRWVAAFERQRAKRLARKAAALVRQGRHEAALARLEAAHRLAPRESEIREALGRVRKQVAKELDDPYLTGTLCFKNGDMESARTRLGSWLEEAKEPEQRFMAHGMLCEAELSRGDAEKASAHLAEVLALDPHDLYAQYLKGRLAVARGDRVEARRAFERFLDREPSFARVRLRVLEKMET